MTALEVTTESGRVYHIDTEQGLWSRSPGFMTMSIWSVKAGTEKVWPWDKPSVWEDRMPVVGEHLYIRGKDEWYVSNPVASIKEIE